MFGTIFNVVMIIVGSIIGSIFKKGIKDEYQDILMQAMGLAATALGINAVVQHLPSSKYPVLFIVSLALGGLIGEKINLEMRFNTLVNKFSKSNLAEGLSTAILLFCIGSLSILGPVEAALKGNYTYLLANGMLDGITSIVLASTFGIGIAASAIVLFAWQGSIYLAAKLMESSINTDLLNEVTIVGGLLILSSGLSILGIKKFKTLNLLPSILIPPVVILVISIFNL
ncbi:hypothetical protein COM86_25120 [Priestia megaterium]|jgi:uncharacterized membrane protein YqgA involved in biofilm formation|uniref:DUF554 domain-containing protein n=1 Tax=Priestia megaterium TaxID=1404 RepID=A0A2B4FYW0_PRIMG|nr:DUF554 domain-containing protein [Priestia megaterium]MBV6738639.1 DUF554 domain-containing protein [Priestia megaterium]MDH3171399.1 DUF554 domain-containing protein [Priestia megaterium]PEB61266.1 hypothetical protein COM86_25120 [Priestia megaterium]PEE73932.1 hypothetical protein COM81_25840 [Priestia megaterium]PFI93962.1 hypothetical protein COI84_17640 [Priestia megaterium]